MVTHMVVGKFGDNSASKTLDVTPYSGDCGTPF